MKKSESRQSMTFEEYKSNKTEIYYFGNEYGLFIDIDNKNMSRKIYIYRNIKPDLPPIMENDIESQNDKEHDKECNVNSYRVSINMVISATVIFASVMYISFCVIII